MKLVKPDVRDAALIDDDEDDDSGIDFDRRETPIERDVRNAFLARLGYGVRIPSHATFSKRYRIQGVSYSVHGVHEGNSGVQCKESDVPYRIEDILIFPDHNKVAGEAVWFVVRAHLPANVEADPYAAYPFLRAKMWGVAHEKSIKIIPFSSIAGHFAKCVIPWNKKEVAVCVSLSRTQPPM